MNEYLYIFVHWRISFGINYSMVFLIEQYCCDTNVHLLSLQGDKCSGERENKSKTWGTKHSGDAEDGQFGSWYDICLVHS